MASASEPEVERRPEPSLLLYYALFSLILGPFFPILLIPAYLRYRTLRYRFDEDGVVMRWGALFQRETSLTYSRIQDIHLASNLVERHLGLARVLVQTASGSSKAEMTIEGLPDFEAVRDSLYARMRGARSDDDTTADERREPAEGSADELADLLRQAAEELTAVRRLLEEGRRE